MTTGACDFQGETYAGLSQLLGENPVFPQCPNMLHELGPALCSKLALPVPALCTH